MVDLTDRQVSILKAIIEEYMETAEPIGSEILDKKYHLGISPATIRNEMAAMVEKGFLYQPHVSAGRAPTPMAIKFYVRQLMEEEELSVADEVSVKGRIWDYRTKANKLLKEATRVLSEKTSSLAIATTHHGDVYHSGYAAILDEPEFYDIDVAKTILSIIEDFEKMNQMFSRGLGEEPIHILIGDDLGVKVLARCGLVFTNFETSKIRGSLGVVGSCRLNYATVIPTLRYLNSLVEKISQSW